MHRQLEGGHFAATPRDYQPAFETLIRQSPFTDKQVTDKQEPVQGSTSGPDWLGCPETVWPSLGGRERP